MNVYVILIAIRFFFLIRGYADCVLG